MRARDRAFDNFYMRGFAWIAVAALWGCTQTVQDEARGVCQVLCTCTTAPLPAVRADCQTKCTGEFSSNPLPQQCIECVLDHQNKCTTFEDDCNPLCQRATPGGGEN